MKATGVLYVLCGKMASGKSTLARKLARERGAIRISEDRLLADLYPGEVSDVASYVEYSGRIRRALEAHVRALLEQGTSVVLDFAANTPRQRAWMRRILDETGAAHELHELVVEDEVCLARLVERAAQQPEHRATDTEAMFRAITAHYRPPSPDEGFTVIRHE